MSKKRQKRDEFTWGLEVEEDPYVEQMRKFNAPIEAHSCEKFCSMYPDAHDVHEIFDDFKLSQRQRELIYMEIVRSRGRYNHEQNLWRRYQSTKTGEYVLRIQTTTELTREVMGDLFFDTEDDCTEYYNYGLQAFKFTELKPIVPDVEIGFLADCDDLDEMTFDFGDTDDEFDFEWGS